MSTIYRKTAKGQAEIETRAHRLSPRLRGALILVDGQRNDDELLKMIPVEAHATLAALMSDGFIEVAMTLAAAPPKPAAAATPGASAAARKEPSLEAVRRDVVRALNDQLGPAAEGIAMKIERAKAMPDLQPLLAQAAQLLGSVRGPAAAEAFVARFLTPSA